MKVIATALLAVVLATPFTLNAEEQNKVVQAQKKQPQVKAYRKCMGAQPGCLARALRNKKTVQEAVDWCDRPRTC